MREREEEIKKIEEKVRNKTMKITKKKRRV